MPANTPRRTRPSRRLSDNNLLRDIPEVAPARPAPPPEPPPAPQPRMGTQLTEEELQQIINAAYN
jgi:hypothetical protein